MLLQIKAKIDHFKMDLQLDTRIEKDLKLKIKAGRKIQHAKYEPKKVGLAIDQIAKKPFQR